MHQELKKGSLETADFLLNIDSKSDYQKLAVLTAD